MKEETPKTAEEVAIECAKRKPKSYYAEPFEPHEWVIDAMDEYAEQARREERERLADVLHEARLQIEYLHGKFTETGSGNAVIAKIDLALAAAGYGKEEQNND